MNTEDLQHDPFMNMGRGPWVEVDLERLKQNLRGMSEALPEQTDLMLIVKSNGYGHGIKEVSRVAIEEGIHRFAVAYEEEALALRELNRDVEILILGVTQPASLTRLSDESITLAMISEEHCDWLISQAKTLSQPVKVQLKVDTGMRRLGVHWDEADRIIEKLSSAKNVNLVGFFSHFATVEKDDPVSAKTQVERFTNLKAYQRVDLLKHISSTRAVLFYPEWDFDAVRTGVSAYGYGTKEEGCRFNTEPILEWKTTVMQVKTVSEGTAIGYYAAYKTKTSCDIITIKVGYADGYPRLLSNKGFVCINGHRRKVVGRISMNWVTVEAPANSGIKAGDEVVLIGRQGDSEIWADELAKTCKTIPYEIVTSIRPGIPRIFKR